MNHTSLLATFICLLISSGCIHEVEKITDENFYENSSYKESDIWRMPIVYPYQLITAYCCEDWNFSAVNDTIVPFRKHFISLSPDSLNVEHDYIILHQSFSGPTWNIIHFKTKEEFSFESIQDFEVFKKEHNISDTMYSCKQSYDQWKLEKKLPWQ